MTAEGSGGGFMFYEVATRIVRSNETSMRMQANVETIDGLIELQISSNQIQKTRQTFADLNEPPSERWVQYYKVGSDEPDEWDLSEIDIGSFFTVGDLIQYSVRTRRSDRTVTQPLRMQVDCAKRTPLDYKVARFEHYYSDETDLKQCTSLLDWVKKCRPFWWLKLRIYFWHLLQFVHYVFSVLLVGVWV
jgi:hypothetical protein